MPQTAGRPIRPNAARGPPSLPDRPRRVIDRSGDGQEKPGFIDARARDEAIAAGISINAIAID
ncbi:DUF1194 domain-containing protein [Rhodobacter calidifons]|uniref:DUF1194 domain-containing protein n=1 Tax=Rhodobacter calidifons TaxID=2715277 RepID=A0ABX0G8G5_9RHOB|nr:DUF1194 domain-containing protein [Rhodobacter calidifons]NHB77570.1 DUF1194 domain-containing protein [Rhodobacter calidifons]